jgi:L-fuculose-phosphate aldolase
MDRDLRKDIIDAGLKLVEKGLVSRTWGNISIRINEDYCYVTPKGRKYEDISVNDIVKVNINTLEYNGNIRPTSEVKMHALIYQKYPNINAIIHTHQMNASTCAVAGKEVPTVLDDFAQIVGPTVKVAPYALPGTKKLTNGVAKALKGRKACLLANHGAVCVGDDIDDAFVVSEVLEKNCKAYIESSFLGQTNTINKFEAYLMHQVYLRKYSKNVNKNK